MVDFVKLGPLFHRVLVLLGFVGLMSQSLLIYFLQPLPRFRFRRRKALEGVILVLLILLESDLIQDIQLGREEPYGTGFRLVLGGSLLVLALWQQGDSIRYLSLCLAGMAILPFFDGSYPWEMGLALGLFLVRSLDLLPETIQEKRMQITEYSIQEAIDSLEEGVLISLASGEPVLMNRALFRYTESVLGVGIRNGNMLWHLLQDVRRPGLHRENQGRGLLFRLPDGRWLLFQRVKIYFQGQSHWQLTASDVTELQRLNQSLDQQNRQLQQKNAELKELLQHVQEIQSRETLREIRIRIHDLMGMRISLLQQVLNNRNFADYQRIMPLLVSMLSDVRQEIRVKPQVRLAELVSVYRKLGGTGHRAGKSAGGGMERGTVCADHPGSPDQCRLPWAGQPGGSGPGRRKPSDPGQWTGLHRTRPGRRRAYRDPGKSGKPGRETGRFRDPSFYTENPFWDGRKGRDER